MAEKQQLGLKGMAHLNCIEIIHILILNFRRDIKTGTHILEIQSHAYNFLKVHNSKLRIMIQDPIGCIL